MRSRYTRKSILYGLALTLLGLATPHPADPVEREVYHGERVLAAAMSMIGRPYRYRGATPAGFDCSGLVQYSFRAAGMDVPRATSELVKATHSVDYRDMRRGDLVFFDRNGKKYGHVGIYAGGERFIHAPSRGKYVRIDSLRALFWKERFNGARRFDESTLPDYSARNKRFVK